MASQFLKDIASGALLGTTPGVTRPTVKTPSPFDDEERMDISDRFRPTPDYTSPDSFYSGTSVGGEDGETYYTGALDVTGIGADVGDRFVGMDKYLGAGLSPLGFNPFIAAGSAISKKNLTNIQNKMRAGEEGYGVGMLGGRIVGVSPGPFGGYVLSGVLPEGLTAGQRKQIIDQLLAMNYQPPVDPAVPPGSDYEDPDTGLTGPESDAGAGGYNPDTDAPSPPDPSDDFISYQPPPYSPPPDDIYYGDPGDDSGPPPGNEYTIPSSPPPDYSPPPSYDYYGDPGDSSGSAGTPVQEDDNFDPGNPGGGNDSGGGSSDSGGDYGTPDFDIGDYMRQGGRVGMQAGGTASKDPVQSTGFVDGPPQNYAKGTTVADTENHRVRVGSFVLNAPTTERLQKEGKLPKGPQKRKAAKGGKMMDVALSKGEYVIDVDDIGKFGGYAALEKENDKGKPEVERRQAAAQGGFLGGYQKGGNVNLGNVLPAGDEYKTQNISGIEMLGARALGVGKDINRALAVAKAYDDQYQPKDNDKSRDTLRHILAAGYMNDQDAGFFEAIGQDMAKYSLDSRELDNEFFVKESEIDLNNNKFGRALREKFPDREEFTRAAVAVVEMLRRGESYEVNGLKPQMSIGYNVDNEIKRLKSTAGIPK
jgi:hypothetical protein